MTDLVADLETLSTATVSDALDRLGIAGQASGIVRLSGEGRLAGPAFTVRYEPVGPDGGTVGDYIDDVEPGSVVVLANGGRLDCTVWGGLLSLVAARRRIAGTVIDGICRDIEQARDVGYRLYARAAWMRTGKDRVRAEASGVPVSLGGIRVCPGDLLLGDADGVVAIPRPRAGEVIAAALQIAEAEAAIASHVAGGDRLDEARARHNYFGLQQAASDGGR